MSTDEEKTVNGIWFSPMEYTGKNSEKTQVADIEINFSVSRLFLLNNWGYHAYTIQNDGHYLIEITGKSVTGGIEVTIE